ncbi:MAG: hypothetical protein LBU75_09510 [Desulfovibrio sp.]|jgi:hypothetical protein|nr:hypothetical protein [Desulfovibrio sp.]
MATLPAFASASGRTYDPASGAAPESSCGPRRDARAPGGFVRRVRLVLVCALALAIVLAPGCVVRSRGQYDVSVSKTSRS